MADDLGWGDVSFNGNTVIRTPHLAQMAREGMIFNRFYAAAPVCSPTRGSCLTGRHPFRYGIYFAMSGHMKPQEVTLAEVLKEQGYTTGHFGKWHLGTLTNGEQNRWGGWAEDPVGNFSPPWLNGYDTCFVTESKVPTWDPMVNPPGWGDSEAGARFGNDYWTGPGQKAEDNLRGDDSRVIMDRVLPFIENAVRQDQPFFSVVWFHTPHRPVVAGPEYRARYSRYTEGEQHYYGCITAMDEQIGRLRAHLRDLGVAENTMIWFGSDNGPEGREQGPDAPGSAGPFSGRKRSLREGGVRVPAVVVWPGQVEPGSQTDLPAVTSDYFPTIMDALGLYPEGYDVPMDGISLLPLLAGGQQQRNQPIGFQSQDQLAWMNDRYKIYSSDGGDTFQLFDLIDDPAEQRDLSADYPSLLS